MRKHERECLALCREVGIDARHVVHRGRHLAVETGLGVVIFPSTPGDRRWKHNMRAVLRHHLGLKD